MKEKKTHNTTATNNVLVDFSSKTFSLSPSPYP
jgi:hypothetical protein